jgi:type II secretory ATPase GspE/PulE/Tfp pilus assembly ATPase PilB-like protein
MARAVTNRQNEVVELIRSASEQGASDVHLRVGERGAQILFRVDGDLTGVHDYPATHGYELCGTIYGSMCDVADPTYKAHLDQGARMKKSFLEQCGLHGARVETRPTDDGTLMVLRLLYHRKGGPLSLRALGYEAEQVMSFQRMYQSVAGLHVLSGPTGSGKSTTLESVMSDIIREYGETIHVLTIEDPPEYPIEFAVQTPIKCNKDDAAEVSRAWASSISNSMRLDPDMIMVGEIRDYDSAMAGFRAAMTGHPVWTTLHANDAFTILDRLADMRISEGLLCDATNLSGLINQSLMAKNCPHCAKPYLGNENLVKGALRRRLEMTCDLTSVKLRGDGCPACARPKLKRAGGVLGRTVAAEVLMPNQKVLDEYRSRGKAAAREMWVTEHKGITKTAHLIRKIEQGIVDPRIAERAVGPIDNDIFQGLAKPKG